MTFEPVRSTLFEAHGEKGFSSEGSEEGAVIRTLVAASRCRQLLSRKAFLKLSKLKDDDVRRLPHAATQRRVGHTSSEESPG
jgi:hypothetical protein